jgi:hypothetical protein
LPKENVYAAALELFPFLARYARSSTWNIYLEPVEVGLAREHPEVAGSDRCPCYIRLVLLNSNGDEIGFVGERTKVIPASKFFRWTIRPAETVTEQFYETVQQALERFPTPTSRVLIISESALAWGYNLTMFFPPDGQSVNERLAQLLEEKRQTEETRMADYRRLREQRREEDAITQQRELLKKALKRAGG